MWQWQTDRNGEKISRYTHTCICVCRRAIKIEVSCEFLIILPFLFHTHTCLEIGSRNATLRRGVGVAFSVVRQPLSLSAAAAAAAMRCVDDVVTDEELVSTAADFTISKSSSRADSAKRVKSNLRWTTVKPGHLTASTWSLTPQW